MIFVFLFFGVLVRRIPPLIRFGSTTGGWSEPAEVSKDSYCPR
jgi:hypothetical protein